MVPFQIILEELHVILFKLREIKDLPQRTPCQDQTGSGI